MRVRAIAVLVALFGLTTLVLLPATATDSNQVDFWCESGVKHEPVDTPYVVPEPPADSVWTLLVLKAGSGEGSNHEVAYPVVGQAYEHPTGRDISHVILCYEEESGSTTTTEATTTTTTEPPSSTTTSTSSTSTSTSTTTSTTQPTTTTSTTSSTTTSTTQPPSTTTTLGTTTTTVVVEDTTTTTAVVTTPTDPPPPTRIPAGNSLPETGLEAGQWAAIAVLLIGLGSLLLAGSYRAFASDR